MNIVKEAEKAKVYEDPKVFAIALQDLNIISNIILETVETNLYVIVNKTKF